MNPAIVPGQVSTNRTAKMTAPMTLTVIIVNWNSGTFLRSCLGSIRRAAGRMPIHTIVVDNASKDGSAELVEREFPDVRLLRTGKNLGFGRGNNAAQSHVSPGYVLFLNPDTELRDGALTRMVDFLESHPDTGAVGCKMIFPDGETADQNLQWFPTPVTEFLRHAILTDGLVRSLAGILPWNDPAKSGYVSKLYGGCLMIRTSVLEKVGWFDERFFMYAEDVDLSRRIREAGWQLYYLTDAEIMHVAGGTTEKAGSGFSVLMGCESMMQLIGKYQGRISAAAYRVAVFGASVIRLCLLSPLWIASPALSESRKASCREARANCRLRILWALRLRSVSIPK
jgi:GT2 family glycosyltransferase